VGETEGNRPLERLGCWWELSTKMDIEKMAGGVFDWIRMSRRLGRWWELSAKMDIEKLAGGVFDCIRTSHD